MRKGPRKRKKPAGFQMRLPLVSESRRKLGSYRVKASEIDEGAVVSPRVRGSTLGKGV